MAAKSLGLNLNLKPLASQKIASQQEETDALYGEPIEVRLVLADPREELVVRCSIGEALQSFVERLVVEHGYAEAPLPRFYLEHIDPTALMLNPYSLNEFARVRELAARKEPVTILVEGKRTSASSTI